MKGSLSAAEVHKQYSEGVTAFRRQIADATLRVKFTQERMSFSGPAPWAYGSGTVPPSPPARGVL